MQRQGSDDDALENRPGVFMIGTSNVGKRTLLSRLLSVDFEDDPEGGPSSSTNVTVHGWSINTKYYTADVSLWMAHLHDGFDIRSLPILDRLEALVMVFDFSDMASFTALQDWVSRNDIKNFEILLCIGNKVDLLPDHPIHAEHRRRVQKLGDDSDDFYAELTEYGISENEGSSLLGEEKSSKEIRESCLEWCSKHNIEYLEACASNADFDKCLSVHGDSQGIERLFGALSAHMWPGMILKSGDTITKPSLPEKLESSEEEESDYELEYEILSAGSAEPWDDTDEGWVSASGPVANLDISGSIAESSSARECNQDNGAAHAEKDQQSMRLDTTSGNIDDVTAEDLDETLAIDETGASFDFEDLEQLMSEIGNIRDNLRLMPDFQRREMAAKLAMKMASMFDGGGSDEEEEQKS